VKIFGIDESKQKLYSHVEKILPKLISACFALRSIKSLVSPQMLKATYYSQFHSIILYGLMFWGNST